MILKCYGHIKFGFEIGEEEDNARCSMGILFAHLGAFGSVELEKRTKNI